MLTHNYPHNLLHPLITSLHNLKLYLLRNPLTPTTPTPHTPNIQFPPQNILYPYPHFFPPSTPYNFQPTNSKCTHTPHPHYPIHLSNPWHPNSPNHLTHTPIHPRILQTHPSNLSPQKSTFSSQKSTPSPNKPTHSSHNLTHPSTHSFQNPTHSTHICRKYRIGYNTLL